MTYVVTFTTTRFDITREPPNPVNPIAGHSVLQWMRDALIARGYQASEPDTEDWGWYMDVERDGASYLVGASGDASEGVVSSAPVEWTLQVHRHRSVKDRLLGRNTLTSDDALCALIESVVRAESDMGPIEVTFER